MWKATKQNHRMAILNAIDVCFHTWDGWGLDFLTNVAGWGENNHAKVQVHSCYGSRDNISILKLKFGNSVKWSLSQILSDFCAKFSTVCIVEAIQIKGADRYIYTLKNPQGVIYCDRTREVWWNIASVHCKKAWNSSHLAEKTLNKLLRVTGRLWTASTDNR